MLASTAECESSRARPARSGGSWNGSVRHRRSDLSCRLSIPPNREMEHKRDRRISMTREPQVEHFGEEGEQLSHDDGADDDGTGTDIESRIG